MKYPRLSAIFAAVSAASLLMVSTAGIAAHKSHKVAEQENFKGEANFKAEVPPPCPTCLVLHDGFYLGVGVGYDSYRAHQSTNVDIDDPVLALEILENPLSFNHSATGWMGGLFAGYGHYFDMFYLGAELNANASNADTSFSRSVTTFVGTPIQAFSSYNVNVKARTSYGVALLPGIKLNDSSLLYVRLGYLRSNFKISENFTNPISIFVPPFLVSGSSNKWVNGFNYGVGIETAIAEQVSIRGEFDHTQFNSRTISHTFVNQPFVGDVVTTSTSIKPSNNEFMLSLLYHFC